MHDETVYMQAYYYACGRNDEGQGKPEYIFVDPDSFGNAYDRHIYLGFNRVMNGGQGTLSVQRFFNEKYIGANRD